MSCALLLRLEPVITLLLAVLTHTWLRFIGAQRRVREVVPVATSVSLARVNVHNHFTLHITHLRAWIPLAHFLCIALLFRVCTVLAVRLALFTALRVKISFKPTAERITLTVSFRCGLALVAPLNALTTLDVPLALRVFGCASESHLIVLTRVAVLALQTQTANIKVASVVLTSNVPHRLALDHATLDRGRLRAAAG